MSPALMLISSVSLAVAVACALAIVVDLVRHPQRMWIMNLVWPITALWSGPAGLVGYVKWGRAKGGPQPFCVLVAKAATHCGSGCTLGDIVSEGVVAALFPLTIFGHEMFGTWVYDYAFALLFGVAFQYFTIAPMRDLSLWDGLVEATKADFLSLTAWQIGMYGWMAISHWGIFHGELPVGSPAFWFVMQIAMFFGFATSYPVNWILLRRGIKEKM
jgi:hypothetical protein